MEWSPCEPREQGFREKRAFTGAYVSRTSIILFARRARTFLPLVDFWNFQLNDWDGIFERLMIVCRAVKKKKKEKKGKKRRGGERGIWALIQPSLPSHRDAINIKITLAPGINFYHIVRENVTRGKYNSKPTYGEISSSLVANDECVSLGDKTYIVMLLVET